MPQTERDPAYLYDIVSTGRELASLLTGISVHRYLETRALQLATERAIEIIGEATRRLSEGLKQEVPDVPWQRIIAQRNVIAHEYGEIRQERIWAVATVEIPKLVARLEPLLPPSPTS